MYIAVAVFYCLVCAFLIFVVLLQQGRGGGMGSAFGGSSQTVFGGAGAGNVLTRITSVCAVLFMVLSATLAYMSSSSDSTLDEVSRELEAEQTGDEVTGEEGAAPAEGTEAAPAEGTEAAPAEGTEAAPAEAAPAPAAEAAPAEAAPAPAAEPAPVEAAPAPEAPAQ